MVMHRASVTAAVRGRLLPAFILVAVGPLPASALSRLADATAADLDRWARRILKAKTLTATLT